MIISSIDLFFKREDAGGSGPAVEAAVGAVAVFGSVVAPVVAVAAAGAAFDVAGVTDAPPNKLGAGAEAVVVDVDAAGADDSAGFAPNKLGAADAGVDAAGVFCAGFAPKRLGAVALAGVADGFAPNRLGAAVVGALAGVAADDAAGAAPNRPGPGAAGLLAPKRFGAGVVELAGVAPPNREGAAAVAVEGVADDCDAGALAAGAPNKLPAGLAVAGVLPKRFNPPAGGACGVAAGLLAAPPNNPPPVAEAGVPPKSPVVGVAPVLAGAAPNSPPDAGAVLVAEAG